VDVGVLGVADEDDAPRVSPVPLPRDRERLGVVGVVDNHRDDEVRVVQSGESLERRPDHVLLEPRGEQDETVAAGAIGSAVAVRIAILGAPPLVRLEHERRRRNHAHEQRIEQEQQGEHGHPSSGIRRIRAGERIDGHVYIGA
jgi:hypothetical protein